MRSKVEGWDLEKPINVTPTEKDVDFFHPSYNFAIDYWVYRDAFSICCIGFHHLVPNVGYLEN